MHSLPKIDRIDVGGINVSAASLDEAADWVAAAVAARARTYVCVRDAHGIIAARHNPALREAHNAAGMVTPDGMPIVWTLRALGARNVTRVYGPDLMLAVSDRMRATGARHYYFGGAPGLAETLAAKLSDRFPGLAVAGTFSPPFREQTDAELADACSAIDATGADIVWVGLSTPKQELWMARARPHLAAPVLIGVGAAFDFHAGTKRQAPLWMQRNGLEWLFRVASEPKRLGRRYLKTVPLFGLLAVSLVLRARLGLRTAG